MEKYILMYSQEREMSIHGVFDTPEAAREAMENEFNNSHLEDLGIASSELLEQIECDACAITDTHAWYNLFRIPVDWKIAKIEII